MPSEKDGETEEKRARDAAAADEASDEQDDASDDGDETDEGEERDSDDEAGDAPQSAGPDVEGAVEDLPRNRAERRAQSRRERRGVRPNRSAPDVVAERIERRRPPPRTVSGKSSADEVPPWAKNFVDWMGRNRGLLIGATVAVLAAVGGSIGWVYYREGQEARASSLYYEALETSSAPVRGPDAPPEPPNAPPRHGPTFTDYPARSRAALEAFRRVEHDFPKASVVPLARLSEAATLYDLGRYADAKPIYESLIGSDVGGQEGRVLEGLGYTLEAMNDLPGALRRFEELTRLQDGTWRDVGQLHQARILAKQNQNQRAVDILHSLIGRLARPSTDEAANGTSNGTIHQEAQGLLHDIAPEDPMGHRSESAGEGGGQDAAIRRLIEQMRRRGAAPGGAPPGGAPGGPPGGGPGGAP